MEEDYSLPPFLDNPTISQTKIWKKKKTKEKEGKVKACLFNAVSQGIFNRIMMIKSAKEIWDFLKKEYEEDEGIKGMKALNLIRSLPKIFDFIICSLETSKDLTTIFLAKVLSVLQA
uniref:Retrovirus-related Pol polyprotein from transposon TNT 1-94 n=1 Tax=Cajanus cajan TaxID=3821 RepID=A0A151RA14_CAJCA|nr:hypothetical protein KK1_039313 [Cajanus cajan]